MENVALKDPESMNLLGLIMKVILERNLADPAKAAAIRNTTAVIAITGGQMSITLKLDKGRVVIERGLPERSNSRITGTMDALLMVCTTGNYVTPFLKGKIKIGGNPFLLLRLIGLIKVADTAVEIKN